MFDYIFRQSKRKKTKNVATQEGTAEHKEKRKRRTTELTAEETVQFEY